MRFAVCGGGLAHEHHACFRELVAVINLVDFDFRFDVELRFVEILEVQLRVGTCGGIDVGVVAVVVAEVKALGIVGFGIEVSEIIALGRNHSSALVKPEPGAGRVETDAV